MITGALNEPSLLQYFLIAYWTCQYESNYCYLCWMCSAWAGWQYT